MTLKDQLINFFHLKEDKSLFMDAIHPKSCGGGKDFKFLALFGDSVLNLVLLELISMNKLIEKDRLTEIKLTFHNEETLFQIANHLRIPTVMEEEFSRDCITKNNLKESIEALLGATYQIHGLKACKQIITNMVKIAQKNSYLNTDPISKLQELFQEKGFPLPEYITIRVGGPDHQSVFQCTLKGKFEGKHLEKTSSSHSRKKEAEKDAAKLFLKEIGAELKVEPILNRK